jgi:transcription factor STE12
VSTSTTASEHDPNEKTARPGNAHQHAQFLAGALTSSHSTTHDDPEPNPSLLLPEDPDDPGATPVVTRPPPPPPLNSTDPADPADGLGLSFADPGLSRPLSVSEKEKLAYLDRLKFFLATAPSQWDNARPTQSFVPTSGANAYPSAESCGAPSAVGSSTGWGMGLSTTGNGAGVGGPGADAYAQGMHPSLNRFMLPTQEFVTCVLWNGLYHITGTDIVRALVFRFEVRSSHSF